MVTHLFCVEKNAFDFSLISSTESWFLPPRAGVLLIAAWSVPNPDVLVELEIPVNRQVAKFDPIPPPTLYFIVNTVLLGVSPRVEYSSPSNGSIAALKSSVCPGIVIPACCKSKNELSIVVPFFRTPFPNIIYVVLSSLVSTMNLLFVWMYLNEYGTAISSLSFVVASLSSRL